MACAWAGEKLERLFGMPLDDLYEITSWEPIAELDPFRLSVRVQVTRVVFTICQKKFLEGGSAAKLPASVTESVFSQR